MSASSAQVYPWVANSWISGDRVVRAAARAEPVRARLEIRLKDGFEHELEGGLDYPVGDGRYP